VVGLHLRELPVPRLGPASLPRHGRSGVDMHGRVRRRGRAGTAQSNHIDVVYASTRRTAGSRSRSSSTPRCYRPGAGRTMVPSSINLLFVCRYIGLEDTMRLTSSTCRPALASHPSGRPRPATRLHDGADLLSPSTTRLDDTVWKALLGVCWTQQNTEVVEQAAKMVRLVMPTYSCARSCGARLPCQD
jgi:hypothetical protein